MVSDELQEETGGVQIPSVMEVVPPNDDAFVGTGESAQLQTLAAKTPNGRARAVEVHGGGSEQTRLGIGWILQVQV